jgi:hypothetical protein
VAATVDAGIRAGERPAKARIALRLPLDVAGQLRAMTNYQVLQHPCGVELQLVVRRGTQQRRQQRPSRPRRPAPDHRLQRLVRGAVVVVRAPVVSRLPQRLGVTHAAADEIVRIERSVRSVDHRHRSHGRRAGRRSAGTLASGTFNGLILITRSTSSSRSTGMSGVSGKRRYGDRSRAAPSACRR